MLIAVVTCHARRHQADAIRQTWGKGLTNIRYFLGGGSPEREDEIILDVPDDYDGLPVKVKAAMQWVIDGGYGDGVLKVDDDVYIAVPRLIKMHLSQFDYLGNFRSHNGNYPYDYASGFAYYLSLRAATIVAGAPLTSDTMEDRHVGNVLGPLWSHLEMYDEKRFACVHPFGIDEPKYLWGSPFGKQCVAVAQFPANKFVGLDYWYHRAFPNE